MSFLINFLKLEIIFFLNFGRKTHEIVDFFQFLKTKLFFKNPICKKKLEKIKFNSKLFFFLNCKILDMKFELN